VSAVLAYVMFKVSSGTEREVAQKLIDFEEVLQADVIFGEYDVVAKVLAKSLDSLEDFVSDHIRNIPNVLVTSTMIISREYKAKSQRPRPSKQLSPVFGA
jgi:DNA-binding Lrp family transcriptional regulator